MMRSNASLFRTHARLEDTMMRAAMPRTSAADPIPTPVRRTYAAACWRGGVRVAALVPLTCTLAEAVAHV